MLRMLALHNRHPAGFIGQVHFLNELPSRRLAGHSKEGACPRMNRIKRLEACILILFLSVFQLINTQNYRDDHFACTIQQLSNMHITSMNCFCVLKSCFLTQELHAHWPSLYDCVFNKLNRYTYSIIIALSACCFLKNTTRRNYAISSVRVVSVELAAN